MPGLYTGWINLRFFIFTSCKNMRMLFYYGKPQTLGEVSFMHVSSLIIRMRRCIDAILLIKNKYLLNMCCATEIFLLLFILVACCYIIAPFLPIIYLKKWPKNGNISRDYSHFDILDCDIHDYIVSCLVSFYNNISRKL